MILIVDDKPENVFSLKQLLELNNFAVDTALSGEEALKKILKNTYALVILDVQMPDMDGFEVAEAISGYSKAKDTPIIFLSAVNTEKRFIAKGYASGAIDYITKPVDVDILLMKVKTFKRLHAQTQELSRIQKALLEEIEYRKEAEKKKDEFISIASHELKTPLTSIKAYLQLSERSIDKNPEATKSYLHKTNLQLEKLNNLIADLLDISKIESGKLKFNKREFAFQPLLNSAVDIIAQTHPEAKIIINGTADVEIYGDDVRIEQVLINFLTNALKYSPERKDVLVETQVDNDMLTVRVTDYGVGIPKDKQASIFEKFYRVEATSYRFQGLGIGLYICAEILQRHNATYGVESEPGVGSTFYFSIPIIKK
ncbi:hybrid sensor histidine kinase/response regulator (plasmid) [Pedobacter sp. BS3]|uniref:sensor histidine kinase n=1 Tax=Pedobacter sp. BS3 TaxID=2567937 RepID=UPI0011EFA5CB|nr:ATP-binding protein [Pedobacter sp. BS3]TZF85892.1 hybrid sensor histidine kinase/response regulator [Pedobacter sp. BS3]